MESLEISRNWLEFLASSTTVTTKGLTFHPQDDFSISKVECLKVAELALQYANDKPYMFNNINNVYYCGK